MLLLALLFWWGIALMFRLRFQFNLRSLLLLVVAVALPCSWLAVEMKKAREQKAFVAAIGESGGILHFDWQYDKESAPLPNARPPEPAWLRGWLGEDFFAEVVSVSYNEFLSAFVSPRQLWQATDTELAQLEGLTELQSLSLNGNQVTDAGLAHIAGLTRLHYLYLNDTQVTDAGLAYIAGLPQLQYLHLNGHQVTDAGLVYIAGLTRLQYLNLDGQQVTDAGLAHIAGLSQLEGMWLDNTQVTDAGLAHIAAFTQLKELSLIGTKVTDAGVSKLRKALPNCRITGGECAEETKGDTHNRPRVKAPFSSLSRGFQLRLVRGL
jgi:hypothetical protein